MLCTSSLAFLGEGGIYFQCELRWRNDGQKQHFRLHLTKVKSELGPTSDVLRIGLPGVLVTIIVIVSHTMCVYMPVSVCSDI